MTTRRLRSAFFRAAVVAVVAVSVQALHLAAGDRDPTFDTPVVDAAVYHEAALAFSRGEPLIDDAYWQPPLFPMLLGCVYRVCGPSFLAAKVALATVAVLSCLLIQGIGCRLFSRGVGLVAGLMAALYGPFVFFSTQLLPVGPAVFLDLLALAVWLHCLDTHRWHRWFALGAVVGLAAITVANSAVLILPVLGGPAWRIARRREVRRAVVACALVLAGAALPVGAVAARNYAVAGEFVLISTNGGVNLYIGNNARSDETLAIRPGEPWKRFVRQGYREGAETRSEQSRYFFRKTLKEMASQPVAFISGLCRKMLQLANGREMPRNIDPYVFREFSPLLSGLIWRAGVFSFPFGLLVPLAVVGMVGSFGGTETDEGRRHRRAAVLAFVVVYGVSVVLFFVSSRYRLPPAMGLIVFAAAGAAILWSRFARLAFSHARHVGHTTGWPGENHAGRRTIAACLLTLIVVNLPLALPTDGHDFRAELNSFVGQAHASRGELVKAESYLRRSLEQRPKDAAAHAALANVLFRSGETSHALEMLDAAIRWAPRATEPLLALANAQGRQGRLDEAASSFEAVLILDDTSPGAHTGLADVFLATGRAEDAVEHYRSALWFAEDPGPIELRLADALVRIEAYEEAIERYRRGLWRVDADSETLNRVAWLLATCPRVELRDCEQAIRIAEQVCSRTEYGNAAGLDTLAAAYAECGRLTEALTWVKAAIDLAGKEDDSAALEAFNMRRRLYEARLGDEGKGKTVP